jgi:hypothetical protein
MKVPHLGDLGGRKIRADGEKRVKKDYLFTSV